MLILRILEKLSETPSTLSLLRSAIFWHAFPLLWGDCQKTGKDRMWKEVRVRERWRFNIPFLELSWRHSCLMMILPLGLFVFEDPFLSLTFFSLLGDILVLESRVHALWGDFLLLFRFLALVFLMIIQLCEKLGWKGKRSRWDILPLVLSANGQDPQLYQLPEELVLRIKLRHPK